MCGRLQEQAGSTLTGVGGGEVGQELGAAAGGVVAEVLDTWQAKSFRNLAGAKWGPGPVAVHF